MSVEVTGLKELERKLKDIGDRAQKLQRTTNASLSELLTAEFLKTYSRFNSLTEMFNAGGFVIRNADDFKTVPDDHRDEFIKQNTSFADWNELLGAAAKGGPRDGHRPKLVRALNPMEFEWKGSRYTPEN